MSLTGTPLLVVLAVLAVGLPVALGLTWRRLPARLPGVVLRVVGILVCQALAVLLVGVLVNRSFVFYNSWDDLFGKGTGKPVELTAEGQLVPKDGSQGRIEFLNVQGRVSGIRGQVMVWLPPQYDASPKANFPVLMALHGSPGTTKGFLGTFRLPAHAVQAVAAGTAKPFVMVLPPTDVAPSRETECTDIPNGPQADSWLSVDVPEAVRQHFRVTKDHWSTMGWSTGGFCAAKMLLRHPSTFDGAAAVGAYFDAVEDATTGTLFNHDDDLRNQNSPLWLMKHTTEFPVHLLIVSTKHDFESWHGAPYADADEAVRAGTGIPGFGAIVLPEGGHNTPTYDPTIEPAFAWLGQHAGL